VDACDVGLAVRFDPPLTIARQQQTIDCLSALNPSRLEVEPTACAVTVQVSGADSEAARNDAEFAVARALASVGHTMRTAPISTASVVRAATG
jgi:hypothetical protein